MNSQCGWRDPVKNLGDYGVTRYRKPQPKNRKPGPKIETGGVGLGRGKLPP